MIRTSLAIALGLAAAVTIADVTSRMNTLTAKTGGGVEPARLQTIVDRQDVGAAPAGVPALPFAIGGDFTLTDQYGRTRRPGSFDGRPTLVFFGYANCEAICSVALPRMAETVRQLDARGLDVRPVMITVDPKRDTQDRMRTALAEHHPRFIGLTGSPERLAAAQKAFQVESKVVYVTPDGEEIFAHGNYIYLMDARGRFLTLFPPILGPERMSMITEKYLRGPPA